MKDSGFNEVESDKQELLFFPKQYLTSTAVEISRVIVITELTDRTNS